MPNSTFSQARKKSGSRKAIWRVIAFSLPQTRNQNVNTAQHIISCLYDCTCSLAPVRVRTLVFGLYFMKTSVWVSDCMHEESSSYCCLKYPRFSITSLCCLLYRWRRCFPLRSDCYRQFVHKRLEGYLAWLSMDYVRARVLEKVTGPQSTPLYKE